MRLILLGAHRSAQYVAVAVASAIDLDQTVKNGLVKRRGSVRESEENTYTHAHSTSSSLDKSPWALLCKCHYLRQ